MPESFSGEGFYHVEQKNLDNETHIRSWIENQANYNLLIKACGRYLEKLDIFENKLSAEDLAHETMTQALESKDQLVFQGEEKLKNWIKTIAFRKALTLRATMTRNWRATQSNPKDVLVSTISNFEVQDEDEKETPRDIGRTEWLKALQTLSPDRQAVMELWLRNYSLKEIAEELKIPSESTVSTRLSRAQDDLAEYFDVERPKQVQNKKK